MKIFRLTRNFCQEFELARRIHILTESKGAMRRNRKFSQSGSEVVTILVLFHPVAKIRLLKNICQIEHTRHRSFENFLANLISGLTAYSFLEKKPSLKIEISDDEKQKKLTA